MPSRCVVKIKTWLRENRNPAREDRKSDFVKIGNPTS
jgi:hypothetical protein